MRRLLVSFVWSLPLDLGALTLGALLVAGCGSGPIASPNQLYRSPQPQQSQSPDWRQGDARGASSAQPGQMTDREIGRLLARLDALEDDNKHLKQQLSNQYMKIIEDRQAERNTGPAATNAPSAGSTQRPAPSPNLAVVSTNDNAAPASSPASLTRAQLVTELINRIEASKDPGHVKALTVAAISVTRAQKTIEPSLLDPLDPRTREQVARFHQMVAMAFDELATNPGKPIDRAAMIANIDRVFGSQPLKIAAIQLCRRVDSYGVYQPFATTRFLSGRKNRMLVYIEVENFRHEPTASGDYEVRLEQQIELYDKNGETTVWRAGPDVLVDECRNKRRDFFIVYPIELPARLTAGTYRLKVRIADKHSGSICEKTLHDIQIVADKSLVEGARSER